MRHLPVILVSGVVLAASSFVSAADKDRATRHLTAAQATSCIKTASGARAGNITKLEVKVDDNRTICEVHFEDAKGKNFEAHVDVAGNKVLRVKD
jgi:cation transport regulator ChaC